MNKFIAPEQCLERGGHFWNEYNANENVDYYGKKNNQPSIFLDSSNELARYRKCGLCGEKQRLIPAKWVEEF